MSMQIGPKVNLGDGKARTSDGGIGAPGDVNGKVPTGDGKAEAGEATKRKPTEGQAPKKKPRPPVADSQMQLQSDPVQVAGKGPHIHHERPESEGEVADGGPHVKKIVNDEVANGGPIIHHVIDNDVASGGPHVPHVV